MKDEETAVKKNGIKSFHNGKNFETRNPKRVEKVNTLTESYRNQEVKRVIKEHQKRIDKILVVDPPVPESNLHKMFFLCRPGVSDLINEGTSDYDDKQSEEEVVGCEVDLRCKIEIPSS